MLAPEVKRGKELKAGLVRSALKINKLKSNAQQIGFRNPKRELSGRIFDAPFYFLS